MLKKTILFFLSLFLSTVVLAQVQPIKVGVVNARAPFAAPVPNGYSGISADLWQTIADNEKISFKYVPLEHNTDAALAELAKGNVDIVIGPISVTYQRFKTIDYSHPYFLNETALIVQKPSADIGHIAFAFWGIVTSPFILFFLIFFLAYIHVYWYFERTENKDIPKKYRKGISYVIWSHLLQICHVKIPHSLMGRMFSLVWILAVTALLTSILATVTTQLTTAVNNPQFQLKKLSDLNDQTIAAIRGTRTISEMQKAGADVVEVDTLDQAIQLLEDNKVTAVADDYIIAKTYLDTHNYPQLQISDLRIANNVYAIAMRKDQPLMQAINRQILFLQDNGYMQHICEKYINKDADLCAI